MAAVSLMMVAMFYVFVGIIILVDWHIMEIFILVAILVIVIDEIINNDNSNGLEVWVMATRKERYTLVVKPTFPDYANEFSKFSKLDCKTLREARSWYDILTQKEKENSYIYDNVRECRVEL